MDINKKKIHQFLKTINEMEFIYMKYHIELSHAIKSLIHLYKLPKEFICQEFKVPTRKYNDFINGSYEYSVNDMSTLDFLWKQLEKEAIDKNDIVKISKK